MQLVKKVLIIEDEAELRQSIEEILNFEGYDVLEASTGHEGIALLNTEKPDLILCDIMLPDIVGYKVLSKFAESSLSKNTPFIFITALFDREHFRQGMELGADDYLVKPFSREELLKSINTQWSKIISRHLTAKTSSQEIKGESLDQYSRLYGLSVEEKDNVNKLVEEALSVIETSNCIQELIDQIGKELQNTTLTNVQNKILNELKRQVRHNKTSQKELTLFLLEFNLVHPHFIIDLKKRHDKLSSNEVFMASATLMGLDTNQIAGMMHISESSVRKNRYRLKKKLGLSKEADFYSYIESFVQAG